ncbi:hypothetical protein GX411_05335 [Candidatus Fermentibacteria bacterium]|nr:hypothetical protein [Candidatus Fermentibacteria bacterium]
MSLILLLLATAMNEFPAMPAQPEDTLGGSRPACTGVVVHPRLFLAERLSEDGGSEHPFDLPAWLSEMLDGGPLPNLPDLEIRMTSRHLCLGYTFRF